ISNASATASPRVPSLPATCSTSRRRPASRMSFAPAIPSTWSPAMTWVRRSSRRSPWWATESMCARKRNWFASEIAIEFTCRGGLRDAELFRLGILLHALHGLGLVVRLQIGEQLLGHEIDEGLPVAGFSVMAALLLGASF